MAGESLVGESLAGVPPDIAYSFGTGDGDVTTWVSPADLDLGGGGAFDAVSLDFDGDGRLDDAMWDSDLDGVADTVRLDVAALGGDGDERWFTDPPGLGTWGTQVPSRSVGTGPPEPPEIASEPAGDPQAHDIGLPATVSADAAGGPAVLVDTDEDGRMDTMLGDHDGDGYLDSAAPLGEPDTVGVDHASWAQGAVRP